MWLRVCMQAVIQDHKLVRATIATVLQGAVVDVLLRAISVEERTSIADMVASSRRRRRKSAYDAGPVPELEATSTTIVW